MEGALIRRTRAEMIEETRDKLVATGRQAFGSAGYANTSMDDLTAKAGLTRGALYHHFGGKEGLLAAVVDQIDEEVDLRLQKMSATAPSLWEGFRRRCRAYLELSLEQEIRRIIMQDARAVLGDISPAAQRHCIASLQDMLEKLIEQGVIEQTDAQAVAHMLYGIITEASFWIAEPDTDHENRLPRALDSLDLLLRGLCVRT
jgi:AcrR family transcriptional regulator